MPWYSMGGLGIGNNNMAGLRKDKNSDTGNVRYRIDFLIGKKHTITGTNADEMYAKANKWLNNDLKDSVKSDLIQMLELVKYIETIPHKS